MKPAKIPANKHVRLHVRIHALAPANTLVLIRVKGRARIRAWEAVRATDARHQMLEIAQNTDYEFLATQGAEHI